LADNHRDAIVDEATRSGAVLQWVDDPRALDAVAGALGRADRQRLLSPRLHREMFEEIRWTAQSAASTRDGLDVATLELDPTERAGMTLLSAWDVMQTVRELGGGQGLERGTRDAIAGASAVGMLSFSGSGAAAFVAGGRALARVWLRATACGVAFQPMTAVVYILRRIGRGETSDLEPADVEAFTSVGRTLDQVFPPAPGHERLMLFRVAVAPEPSARSLRRSASEVLTYRAPGEDSPTRT
jgi:hypothetical protein